MDSTQKFCKTRNLTVLRTQHAEVWSQSVQNARRIKLGRVSAATDSSLSNMETCQTKLEQQSEAQCGDIVDNYTGVRPCYSFPTQFPTRVPV